MTHEIPEVERCLALARASKAAGRLDEAARYYEQVIAVTPNTEARLSLGKIQCDQGRIQDGVNEILHVLNAEPDNTDALLLLAAILQQLGQKEDAVPLLKKAATMNFDSVEIQNEVGRALEEAGDFDEAVECFSRVLQMTPNKAKAHVRLGQALNRIYCAANGVSEPTNKNFRHAAGVEDAIRICYETAIRLDPDDLGAYEPYWSHLFLTGQMQECLEVIRTYENVQSRLARAKGLDESGTRFLPKTMAGGSGIGQPTMLEVYIKAQVLGLQPAKKIVQIMRPGQHVCNQCYLDYWKKYVNYIYDKETIETFDPVAEYLTDQMSWAISMNGRAEFFTGAAGYIREQWEQKGYGPLLELTDEHRERGRRCLESLGVPRDAWFVCIHVREAGFKNDAHIDGFRNAEIESYMPAIKSITGRGGWVIRMGDRQMKHLPPIEGVIDYAHSTVYSDWMEVFLSAACRFFIGTHSGLAGVAYSFGTPCVQTNYLPMAAVCMSPSDLFIPKMVWSNSEKRLLKINELLTPPMSTCWFQHHFNALDITLKDNTADEINDVVLEMMDKLEGKAAYTDADLARRKRFRALSEQYGTCFGFGITARPGRAFLEKYEALIEGPTEILG